MPPLEAAATLTVGGALAAAAARLRDAGSPTPRLDAELLVGHARGLDRAWLLAHPERMLEADEAVALAGWVERRASGEPIAYIRGFKEWHGLRLRTDARAMIPRPDTELLADLAIAELAARLTAGPGVVLAWDVGTGSGALALVLALRFHAAVALGRIRLVASDLSAEALALAAENLAAHHVADAVTLAREDLLPAGASPQPDVVIANLPYVRSGEVQRSRGSLGFEPSVALDGGADGLDVVRRFLVEATGRVAPGATLLLEIGAGQADAVVAMAPQGASVLTEVDLAGIERVVRVDLP